MQPILLDIPLDKRTDLFAISDQFNEELENQQFPSSTTLQALQKALLDVLEEKDRASLKSGNTIQIVHEDVAIRNLPWQLLTDEKNDTPLVKSIKKNLAPHRPHLAYPLKVLVMVAAPEAAVRLDYEREEQLLLSAFSPLISKGLVEVHFTEDGAFETLEREFNDNKYHILHFSGHGIFDEKENIGKLAMEDAITGKQRSVSAEEINALFRKLNRKNHRPDLVVLSACQTATGESGNFNGVAGKLLKDGTPAVIAMAASILDSCATLFAAQLYENLSNGYELPFAFQQARLAVKDFESVQFQLTERGRAPGQWLIPQLLLSQKVERLIDPNAPKTELKLTANSTIVKGQQALVELRVRPKNYVFVGRRKEKRAAFRVLNEGKAVLLRGQGGVGKTALAEHLAIRKIAQQPRTKVFLHSEKSPSAKSLIEQMTTFLTKEHKQFKVVSELAVINKLSDQFLHLLSAVSEVCEPFFIFDNVESFQTYDAEQQAWVWNVAQHEDVLTLLQILYQYTPYPMVVTSRYPLAEFPEWTQVNMNSAPFGDFFKKCTQLQFHHLASELAEDKVQLTKRSDGKKTDFEDIVRLLYKTLGGNYRALEFFDEAYQKDKKGIGDLLKRLDDLPDHTKSEVTQRMGENLIFQQLLSYLDTEARQVLSLLTRFRIPVLPMALAMQRDDLLPLPALQQLKELTLVEEQGGVDERDRYYIIPLVKELLTQADFEQVAFDAEQAGAYHEYVEQQDIELDALSEISEAFEYYYEAKAVEPINRVGERLNRFYYDIQQFRTSLNYGLRTEEIAQEKTDSRIWNNLGLTFYVYGRYDLVLPYYEKSLADDRKKGDRKGEGRILNNLATTAHAKGDYDRALRYLEQSLQIQQQIGDRQGESVSLCNIGQIHEVRGDYDLALDYYEKDLAICQQIGDRKGEGTTLNNISQIHKVKGDYDTALHYLEQTLQIVREIGDRKNEGGTLNNISQIHKVKGDYDTALRYLEQSLQIRQQIGDRQGEGTTLNNISQIYDAKGDYDRALRYLEQSLQIQQQIGDRKGESTTIGNMASIYRTQKDYQKAMELYTKDLNICQDIGDIHGMAITLGNIGIVFFEVEQYEEAIPYLLESYQIFDRIGSPHKSTSESYLSALIEKIGKDRFREIIQASQNKE